MLLSVVTKPGRRTAKLSWTGEQLLLSVKAPAKEGRANQELIRTLAKLFRLRQNQIQITAGLTSRRKRVRIDLDRDQALQILAGVKPPTQERLL